MLSMYTGTPGSGKTLHATQRIDFNLKIGRNVIANYEVITNHRHKGEFIYKSNDDLTVEYLVRFAMEKHEQRKPSQTVIVIDEAHIKFNTRGYDMKERILWLKFLAFHRHFGFDIIMVTQSDRAIDQQVRGLVEFDYKHRMVSSFGLVGLIFAFVLKKPFVCVKYWYVIGEKCGVERFGIKKRIIKMYDTFGMCDYDMFFKENESEKYSKKSEIAEFNKRLITRGEESEED